MKVAIATPRRSEPWRDKLWEYAAGRLALIGWPIFQDPGPTEGPMGRAHAKNACARAAGDWDVIVFHDADTYTPPGELRAAVERAADTGALVLPHSTFRSLTRAGTSMVLARKIEPEDAEARWIYDNSKSSCIAVPRSLWEEVGGFDERFLGWGWEDAAFYAACQALGKVEHLGGVVHHLWHPRSEEKGRGKATYEANRVLGKRYKALRGDAAGMRELIAER